MNDEKEPGNEPANGAPNTSETLEVPTEKPPGVWEMPQPVFRQSSGYLPQGFEKRFPLPDPQADVPTEEPVADVSVAGAPAQAAAASPATAHALEISENPDIQPQPDVSEEFTLDEALGATVQEKKKRSPAVRIALTLLGILAMIAFAIVFLAVIYYLFLYHPSEPQVIN